MKFIIIGILITNIYSQCDTLDELNCNHPLYGDGCEWYDENPDTCGDYDDDDFESAEVCCSCAGGTITE